MLPGSPTNVRGDNPGYIEDTMSDHEPGEQLDIILGMENAAPFASRWLDGG